MERKREEVDQGKSNPQLASPSRSTHSQAPRTPLKMEQDGSSTSKTSDHDTDEIMKKARFDEAPKAYVKVEKDGSSTSKTRAGSYLHILMDMARFDALRSAMKKEEEGLSTRKARAEIIDQAKRAYMKMEKEGSSASKARAASHSPFEMMEKPNFGESSKTLCAICKRCRESDEMHRNSLCSHSFCIKCVSIYVSVQIESGTTTMFICPAYNCEAVLELSPRIVVPRPLQERWNAAKYEARDIESAKNHINNKGGVCRKGYYPSYSHTGCKDHRERVSRKGEYPRYFHHTECKHQGISSRKDKYPWSPHKDQLQGLGGYGDQVGEYYSHTQCKDQGGVSRNGEYPWSSHKDQLQGLGGYGNPWSSHEDHLQGLGGYANPSHKDQLQGHGGYGNPSHKDQFQGQGGYDNYPTHKDQLQGLGGYNPSHKDRLQGQGGYGNPSHRDQFQGQGGYGNPSHNDQLQGLRGYYPSHKDQLQGQGGYYPSHKDQLQGQGGYGNPSHKDQLQGLGGHGNPWSSHKDQLQGHGGYGNPWSPHKDQLQGHGGYGNPWSSHKDQLQGLGGYGEQVGEPSQSRVYEICEICYERKERAGMFTNKSCSHSVCTDCISKHIEVKIENNPDVILCPGLDCRGVLTPELCKEFLPKRVLERWEWTIIQSQILDSEKFYCPFKDCSVMLLNDNAEEAMMMRESECPHCRRLFCVQCHAPWHSGMECREFQRLNADERGREDTLLRELAKEKKWKRCPRCKFYVEKTEGCVHVTCRCRFEFCYQCGGQWSMNHVTCQMGWQ